MVSAYLASKLGKIARQIFSPWPNAAVGTAPKAALIERICDDAVAAPKLGRPFERPAMLIHAVGRDDDEFGPAGETRGISQQFSCQKASLLAPPAHHSKNRAVCPPNQTPPTTLK